MSDYKKLTKTQIKNQYELIKKYHDKFLKKEGGAFAKAL